MVALDVVGDVNVFGGELVQTSQAFGNLIGSRINVGPNSMAINNFGTNECDIVNQQVFGVQNPTITSNPLTVWMPSGNDINFHDAGHEQSADACRMAGMTWLSVPNVNKVFAQSCTNVGTISNNSAYGGAIGVISTANGDTVTCTFNINQAGPAFLWYQLNGNNAGTFTYAIDGGTPSANIPTQGPDNNFTFPISGATAAAELTTPNLTVGTHTVQFKNTTASTGDMRPLGVATASLGTFAGGGPTFIIPSFSDGTEHLCEEGLGGEHLGEPLDEWQQRKSVMFGMSS